MKFGQNPVLASAGCETTPIAEKIFAQLGLHSKLWVAKLNEMYAVSAV